MTLGIVLFRTKYRSCLKYPVEHTYHHLLVELWTLLQNRRPVEIFQLKQIGSSLGTLGSKFGRVNLCKSLSIQKIPEPSCDSLLNTKNSSLPWIAKCNRTIVEFCLQ